MIYIYIFTKEIFPLVVVVVNLNKFLSDCGAIFFLKTSRGMGSILGINCCPLKLRFGLWLGVK